MTKKAAIELSVNFIVLTVLSLIVLGIGFYIVTNIFTTAEDYKAKLDEQTQESILATLKKSGEIVSLPINRYTIGRGGKEIIGFGIVNTLGTTETFTLTIQCTEATASDNTELCAIHQGTSCGAETGYCNNWIIADMEEETLENRESIVVGLFVQIPDDAPSGTFGYSIKVFVNNEQYDTTKKLYITVPE